MNSGAYLASRHRVLILGVTGMLGHTLMSELSHNESIDIHGSARSTTALDGIFPKELLARVIPGIDATEMGVISELLSRVQPDIVLNCIGVIKQDPSVDDAASTMALNAHFPHRLAGVCAKRDIRLVHVSTDCVFSGKKGRYIESDNPDPVDLYGRSKLLGEVSRAPALTLRTSFIGHELGSNRSLVDWFLGQSDIVKGFTRAIYSGLTAVEFSHMLTSVVFPREDLTGLYHVASNPISKYDLLSAIAEAYGWAGKLVPATDFECDRSLLADSFFDATGYRAPEWPEMIKEMHNSQAR